MIFFDSFMNFLIGIARGFPKPKTRKEAVTRSILLGTLCVLHLVGAIFVIIYADLKRLGIIISLSALAFLFTWRFVEDGILIYKNDSDKPKYTTQAAQQKAQQYTTQKAAQGTPTAQYKTAAVNKENKGEEKMQSINDRFKTKYRKLESLCAYTFCVQQGVEEYINRMQAIIDDETEKVGVGLKAFYLHLRDCKKAFFALEHRPFAAVRIDEKDIEFLDKLYKDIINKCDPLSKFLYTVLFRARGYDVAMVRFVKGATHIKEPAVPPIPGYIGFWESYALGDKDIVVNAVYVKDKGTYTTYFPQFGDAQTERDKFWSCFDKYLAQQGRPFYVAHVKGGKNQAAGNVNTRDPMAMQTICCEYRYRDKEVAVLVYINHKQELFDRLYLQKTDIEKRLGYKLEWIEGGIRSGSVRIIRKVFPINKPYEALVKEIFPYILDFIRVFEPYVKAYAN